MVNITVLKKAFFEDIISEYSDAPCERCSLFEVGQKFVIDDIDKVPDSFCVWAWVAIQRDVAMIEFGATPPPIQKNPHSMISCCTCGARPVIFRIEKVEDSQK
jgi:uncharacterized repeat protein (TIGR04076 family)